MLHPRFTFPVISLVAMAAVGSVAAAAELAGGRIETILEAHSEYDSNIYLNSQQVSDTVFTGRASVGYLRDVAEVTSELTVGALGSVMADHSDQNSFDPFVRGGLTFTPSDKTTIAGNASYERASIANEDLNTRTRSNNFTFDGSLQNLFSEKLGYRVTGNYDDSRYLTDGYADVLSYSAGLDAVYAYSPKLTVVAGYDYRESWTENRPSQLGSDPSSHDDRLSAGVEGQLLPKVSGTLNVGWVKRSFDKSGRDGSSALYFDTGLKWIPREKTSVTINASQDYGLTAAAQSSKIGLLSVGVRQVLNAQWTVDGSASVSHASYAGASAFLSRRDDTYRFKARATYAWTTNVSVDFSLGYANVDSTNSVSTYDRVAAGVGLTATF